MKQLAIALEVEVNTERQARTAGAPRVQGIGGVTNRYKIAHVQRYRDQDRERIQRRYVRRAKWFKDVKSLLRCQVCGMHSGSSVDLHHIDATNKKFSVALANVTRAPKSFIAELEKCAPVCASCHRAIHNENLAVALTPLSASDFPPMPE